MKRSALVILMLNSCCAFSQIAHEGAYFVGCFDDGRTEAEFEFDAEEVLYVDLKRAEVVYTVPRVLVSNQSELFDGMRIYKNAVKANRTCKAVMALIKLEKLIPPEEKDPPEIVLFPAEEVQLGVENSLTCLVNHFFPPDIRVYWTKNDRPVSEGVSLSRYYPNKDQTFRQFSTLTFTPREGDIYSCTVEHSALEMPKTRIWEPEFSHPSAGPDIFCGVGVTLGLLGVAAGTLLMVKGRSGQ